MERQSTITHFLKPMQTTVQDEDSVCGERGRCNKFTDREYRYFIRLCLSLLSVIEGGAFNAVTNRDKARTWEFITESINRLQGPDVRCVNYTKKELKLKWTTLKYRIGVKLTGRTIPSRQISPRLNKWEKIITSHVVDDTQHPKNFKAAIKQKVSSKRPQVPVIEWTQPNMQPSTVFAVHGTPPTQLYNIPSAGASAFQPPVVQYDTSHRKHIQYTTDANRSGSANSLPSNQIEQQQQQQQQQQFNAIYYLGFRAGYDTINVQPPPLDTLQKEILQLKKKHYETKVAIAEHQYNEMRFRSGDPQTSR